jgi:YesN/AraC family two-component response regulator
MTAEYERKRILVVEDEPEMVTLHRDFLMDHFAVVIKTSGADAIRYVRRHHDVHLAVVDYKLPDVTGIEVIQEIKLELPHVPVILITAFGSEDVAVKAFRCGARDYMKKPFTYTELMRRILFCLSLHNVEQEKNRSVLTSETETLTATMVQGARGAKNYRVQQALKFIHTNYSADISLDQVAKSAGVSKYHFSRLFKEATGVNYQSYLNRLRIDHARKLLSDETLSITAVGQSAGYPDLTHFERIFKKLVGITPSRFRDYQSR